MSHTLFFPPVVFHRYTPFSGNTGSDVAVRGPRVHCTTHGADVAAAVMRLVKLHRVAYIKSFNELMYPVCFPMLVRERALRACHVCVTACMR